MDVSLLPRRTRNPPTCCAGLIYELEDWERAESSCKKAASLDPDNSRFHLWLGRVYGEKADRANPLAAGLLAEKLAENSSAQCN